MCFSRHTSRPGLTRGEPAWFDAVIASCHAQSALITSTGRLLSASLVSGQSASYIATLRSVTAMDWRSTNWCANVDMICAVGRQLAIRATVCSDGFIQLRDENTNGAKRRYERASPHGSLSSLTNIRLMSRHSQSDRRTAESSVDTANDTVSDCRYNYDVGIGMLVTESIFLRVGSKCNNRI